MYLLSIQIRLSLLFKPRYINIVSKVIVHLISVKCSVLSIDNNVYNSSALLFCKYVVDIDIVTDTVLIQAAFEKYKYLTILTYGSTFNKMYSKYVITYAFYINT